MVTRFKLVHIFLFPWQGIILFLLYPPSYCLSRSSTLGLVIEDIHGYFANGISQHALTERGKY
jgi:hypothetical protein